jgi:hypothetical protein
MVFLCPFYGSGGEKYITWFSSSRTDDDFCHQGRDTEIAPKYLRLSKPTDMTIISSRGALSDGTISFSIEPFLGKMHFLNFSQKHLCP